MEYIVMYIIISMLFCAFVDIMLSAKSDTSTFSKAHPIFTILSHYSIVIIIGILWIIFLPKIIINSLSANN